MPSDRSRGTFPRRPPSSVFYPRTPRTLLPRRSYFPISPVRTPPSSTSNAAWNRDTERGNAGHSAARLRFAAHPAFALNRLQELVGSFLDVIVVPALGRFYEQIAGREPMAPAQKPFREVVQERLVGIEQGVHAAHRAALRTDPEDEWFLPVQHERTPIHAPRQSSPTAAPGGQRSPAAAAKMWLCPRAPAAQQGLRFDDLSEALDYHRRRRIGVRDYALNGVARLWHDLNPHPGRLRQQIRIPQYRLECGPQNSDLFCRDAGRRHVRLPECLLELHHQRDGPAIGVSGDGPPRSRHAELSELGLRLEAVLHDEVELLVAEPLWLLGLERRPVEAADAVDLTTLHRDKQIRGTLVAAYDFELRPSRMLVPG